MACMRPGSRGQIANRLEIIVGEPTAVFSGAHAFSAGRLQVYADGHAERVSHTPEAS